MPGRPNVGGAANVVASLGPGLEPAAPDDKEHDQDDHDDDDDGSDGHWMCAPAEKPRTAKATRCSPCTAGSGLESVAMDELPGLFFLRDDDRFVLVLVVESAGRGTGHRADRAADDGPDDCAADPAGYGAAGLLVTMMDALLERLSRAARRSIRVGRHGLVFERAIVS